MCSVGGCCILDVEIKIATILTSTGHSFQIYDPYLDFYQQTVPMWLDVVPTAPPPGFAPRPPAEVYHHLV
jgi:hypothetical protein